MERPDGSQSTTFGWILIAIGILAVFVGAGAETFEGTIWGAVVANLGIGLGIILVSLGYLVKAIWFLPGREGELAERSAQSDASIDLLDGPISQAAWEDCEWCGLRVDGPALPCSLQSDDQIVADLDRTNRRAIPEPCRNVLMEKGFLSL